MSTVLFFYVLGVVVSLWYGLTKYKNEKITLVDFLLLLLFSCFSWIFLLGSLVGERLKDMDNRSNNNSDNKSDNKSK